MQHLKDTAFDGRIITTVSPQNVNGRKIAERYGFKDTSEVNEHGYRIYSYTLPDKDPEPESSHRSVMRKAGFNLTMMGPKVYNADLPSKSGFSHL